MEAGRSLRRALFVALTSIALGLGFVAFMLLPAHLQIRKVAPALPSLPSLRAAVDGPDGPVRIRYMDTATQQMEERRLSHTVFVLEWADGKQFMVDAGMDPTQAEEFARLLERIADAGPARFHGTVSDFLGDEVARISGVGFTHLHIDHVQGVLHFCERRGPGARVFQTRWQAEQHNLHTTEGAEILAGACLARTLVAGEGALPVPGFPGLAMVPLGGHTPGSTLFAAKVDRTLWLLSGDIANAERDIADNRGKGFLYSYLIVPEDTERTDELRRWLAELDAHEDVELVVSHDSQATAARGMPAIAR